jgi:hypothetical protein
MADYPPFMNAYGLLARILEKIKQAKTPDRFTVDFLSTKLGFPSGSARAFIPVAKRLGLLSSDGSPTEIYKRFRNPALSGSAIAASMKIGFAEIFARNEYANNLDRKQLEGLVMEITGLEAGNTSMKAICNTFDTLKGFADFERLPVEEEEEVDSNSPPPPGEKPLINPRGTNLGLMYSINLVLPKTDDIAVFNAIFRSLRDNLIEK